MDKGKGVAQSIGDANKASRLKSKISRSEKGKGVGQSSSSVADNLIEDSPRENPNFTFTITADHLSGKTPVALPIEFVRAMMKRTGHEIEDKGPKFTVTLTANHLIGKQPLLIPEYFVRGHILPIGWRTMAQLVVEGEELVTCPLVWERNSDNQIPVTECYLGYSWKLFCEDHGLFDGLEVEFTMHVVGGEIQFCLYWAVLM